MPVLPGARLALTILLALACGAGPAAAPPVKTLHEEEKPRRLVGCDPLVSPLAGSLSQVAGRCIASLHTGRKFAALDSSRRRAAIRRRAGIGYFTPVPARQGRAVL